MLKNDCYFVIKCATFAALLRTVKTNYKFIHNVQKSFSLSHERKRSHFCADDVRIYTINRIWRVGQFNVWPINRSSTKTCWLVCLRTELYFHELKPFKEPSRIIRSKPFFTEPNQKLWTVSFREISLTCSSKRTRPAGVRLINSTECRLLL